MTKELVHKISPQSNGMYVTEYSSPPYVISNLVSLTVRFLWATLQLQLICHQGNEEEVREQLQTMPDGLNKIYERIWTRITGRASHRTQRMWTLKTLELIIFANRPLSSQEILEATSLHHEDTNFAVGKMASSIEYLIVVCGYYIALDSHTSRVRCVYDSVPEFLGSKPEFQLSESLITEACFITLAHQRGRSGEGGQFYAYATRYWAEHSQYLKEIDNRLASVVVRFLLNPQCFDDWLAQR